MWSFIFRLPEVDDIIKQLVHIGTIEMRLRCGSSEINWLPSSLFLSGITNFCFRAISIFTEGKFTTSSAKCHFGPSFFFGHLEPAMRKLIQLKNFLLRDSSENASVYHEILLLHYPNSFYPKTCIRGASRAFLSCWWWWWGR